MCRKLETETEKVLPFYASSLAPEEDDDVAAAMQEAPSEPLAEVNRHSSLLPPPPFPLPPPKNTNKFLMFPRSNFSKTCEVVKQR